MQHDYRKEQPERFGRAVRACCGLGCPYPNCTCTGMPQEIAEAINAWETLPNEPESNGIRETGG